MTLFSERKGIKPVGEVLQHESMSTDLRNLLWNCLTKALWNHYTGPKGPLGVFLPEDEKVMKVALDIWQRYLKKPLDQSPDFIAQDRTRSGYHVIRDYFFNSEWWQAYDLLEFIIKNIPAAWKNDLTVCLNRVLTEESAAYRIVGNEIVEITDEMEIQEIESVLDIELSEVRTHFTRALELLSDHQKPDYRNSIKESISAVEAICRLVAGVPKATLGDCLKKIEEKQAIHPAFGQALQKLYGYSSDEGGIRHAITDENVSPSFSDAKFMLVATSAFVNFILGKIAELGINLTG